MDTGNRPTRWIARGVALGAGLLALAPARALACDDNNPERYRSDKTVWCVDPTVWAEHQSDVEGFFDYGDQVIDKLTQVFHVSPDNLPFSIVARAPDGGAQTPTRYGPGVEVTGDAFWNEFGGVQGYWGYLLVLHEFVNQWTGLVTGGWPTDWWADHRSPFPNAMDELVMRELGHGDAADVQHDRFLTEPQVQLFLDIYGLPGYGFDGYSAAFALIESDDISWGDLRDAPGYQDRTDCVSGNPSALLSEYVIAYLSLPAGENLTPRMVAAGVGDVVDDLCPEYTPSSDAVDGVANAHCAIAAAQTAGMDVADANAALRRGAYASVDVTGYDCAADCPSECACASTDGSCVAPWIGDVPPAMTDSSGGASSGGTPPIAAQGGTFAQSGAPFVGGNATTPAQAGDSGGVSVPPSATSGAPTMTTTAGSTATVDGATLAPIDPTVQGLHGPAADAGCSCRTAPRRTDAELTVGLLLGFALLLRRRQGSAERR